MKRCLAAVALLCPGAVWAQCAVDFSWMAPTEFVNGDPLDPATDLLEYRIYDGGEQVATPAPGTQSYRLEGVEFGLHDYTATAVALNGNESTMSNTADYDCVDDRTPRPPTLIEVILAFLAGVWAWFA